MRKNIYQGDHGGWIVEVRFDYDKCGWIQLGVFDSYAEALKRYATI